MRRTTRRLPTWLALPVLLLACAAPGETPADDPRSWDGRVQVHGALRAMLHEGQTGAQVNLEALLPDPDLYAVGALADLSGEITVVAGVAHLSYPEERDTSRIETTLRPDAGAALLVASSVPSWSRTVTDRAIRFDELDEAIAKLAAATGVKTEDRFPFLLEGTFENLRWHVIDGRRLAPGSSSQQDHQAAGVPAARDRAPATLLGFYSERDQGVFTHMGSKTHIHCVLEDPLAAGHVDHVDVPAGTTIGFPARRD